ncbi:MAG TPA: alginate O-acetyltransferase AlgF [Alphaproteobacteria bacterium]|nr:alginate O-acetyltransferase AlgF [Micavibrio sp.]MBK9561931.1 alginate O-acetyltransferase AlgF [Micavibrio sp.]HQX27132.1 alginate O-acetyltransferase AlgF [Alphaproteobacteria bacterium]
MKKIIASCSIMILGAVTMPAFAQDQGLYDPLPPEGSAFVRFLSESPESGSKQAKANDKGYDYLNFKQVSSYYVIPKGAVKASIGSAAKDFNAESGKFYTVVLNEGGALEVKDDPKNENEAKSQIVFYNLTDKPDLSLKTADGKVVIVPPLSAGAVGDKQINPVKVSIAIFDGETKLKDLGPVSLERGSSYSAIAMNDKDVEWVQASTNTTR